MDLLRGASGLSRPHVARARGGGAQRLPHPSPPLAFLPEAFADGEDTEASSTNWGPLCRFVPCHRGGASKPSHHDSSSHSGDPSPVQPGPPEAVRTLPQGPALSAPLPSPYIDADIPTTGRKNTKSSLRLALLEGEKDTEKTEMKRREHGGREGGGTEVRTVPAPQPLLQALCSVTLQDKWTPHAPAHPGLQN